MPSPFIYINGYPGIGKFTIAKELSKLIPNSIILDNHLLIDPVAAVLDRSAVGYQPLRKLVRENILQWIASTSAKDITWIFTDQQSSDSQGASAAQAYQKAAVTRGSKLISIVLSCDVEENLKRLQGKGRTNKLMDKAILRKIRQEEDIYHVGDELELDLDVTELTPSVAAGRILGHLRSCCDLDPC